MNNEESSDVRIARLEEKLDSLIKSVDLMSASLENLKNTFVPRSEFDQLSVLTKGVAGSGGLVKQIEKLENKVSRYAIVLSIAWFLISVLGIAGWQYFLARVSQQNSPTTTINTTNR